MKLLNQKGIRALFIFAFACSVIMLRAQSTEFNKSLGNLNSHTFKNNILEGSTTAGYFRLTVHTSNIVRVQINKINAFNDFSYAVVSSPERCNASVKEDVNRLTLQTDSIDVIISKSPVRFTMLTKKGDVINQDDASFGTSWLGEEVTTYKKLQDGERFIGLGEKTGNLDRRGQAYTNWNTDYFAYPATADAIYVTTPFYIGIHHRTPYGIFMDNSAKSSFNFGASNNRFSSFTAEEGEMNYYFIYHTSIAKIIESYTFLTGRMQMPPLWSLGLQQSRYSYFPDKEVMRIAKTFRDKAIPADVIYLDIHYMDKYKIFSWDKEKFPNPKGMIDELKTLNFHTAVILDPGIKVQQGYEPYEDGIKKDVFVKYPDNTNYTGEVWPGWCHFPDFTNPDVRTWWGTKFNGYVNDGVDGFWNDMNEPSTWGQSTPNLVEFNFDGHKATHRTARNVYGLNMTRSTFEGTKKLLNGKRPFLLTRSGYSGIQRYSAVWTGDNVASDEHMLLGVRLVNSMGITGIPVTGMDVGGFSGGGSEKLFARWMTIGAFTPFYRVHVKDNSRSQEPWSFGDQVENISRSYVKLRYSLIPYIYSIFYEASVSGIPVSRSLAISYPFEALVFDQRYQNQYTFGQSLLIAPGESTKDFYKVFLPGKDWYDLYSDKHYAGQEEIIADAALDHLPVFVKGGSIIPMQSVVQSLNEKPTDTLQIHIYKGSSATDFIYYEDDGNTYNYQQNSFFKRRIEYQPAKGKIVLRKADGAYSSKFTKIRIVLHGFDNAMDKLAVSGKNTVAEKGSFLITEGHTVPVLHFTTDNLSGEIMISF